VAANLVTRKIGDLMVEIDRNSCSAFKACIDEAPAIFAMGPDDVVTFADVRGTASREEVLAACGACPVAALTARDLSGKVLAP
jgi:ferredoxin